VYRNSAKIFASSEHFLESDFTELQWWVVSGQWSVVSVSGWRRQVVVHTLLARHAAGEEKARWL